MLAIQGGGYVVAGLAMLIWLKDEPRGSGREDGALGEGELALVAADEGIRPLPWLGEAQGPR